MRLQTWERKYGCSILDQDTNRPGKIFPFSTVYRKIIQLHHHLTAPLQQQFSFLISKQSMTLWLQSRSSPLPKDGFSYLMMRPQPGGRMAISAIQEYRRHLIKHCEFFQDSSTICNTVAIKFRREMASFHFFDFLHVNSPLLPFTHLLTSHFWVQSCTHYDWGCCFLNSIHFC